MNINRNIIFEKFSWLKEKNKYFVISADYDGLICASFLSHHLNWKLVGYYNMQNIWLSDCGMNNKNDLIWVDLNILPKVGKSIGGQIAMVDNSNPSGLKTSCNLNTLLKLKHTEFHNKFPFSTLIFLMWLYNIENFSNNLMSRLIILHSDSSWVKFQKYNNNVQNWMKLLTDYNWNNLTYNIDKIEFEHFVDQKFYPTLISMNASTGFSKLKSKHLGIKSRECRFNPDWDEDIVLNLLKFFSQYLGWNTPSIPSVKNRILGEKFSVDLDQVLEKGLKNIIKDKKIFSYAITSKNKMKYTVFNPIK